MHTAYVHLSFSLSLSLSLSLLFLDQDRGKMTVSQLLQFSPGTHHHRRQRFQGFDNLCGVPLRTGCVCVSSTSLFMVTAATRR